MSGMDLFQIIFLIIVVAIGFGGFIWAVMKKD